MGTTKNNFVIDRQYEIVFIPDQHFGSTFNVDHFYNGIFKLPELKGVSTSFVMDWFYNGVFKLPNIAETEIGEMDDQTLGYYDPKTLLEIIIPS